MKVSLHKPLRSAFTLIEVLIAVTILSFAIIYVLKIHSENKTYILYLTERNARALEDSLFLSTRILRYKKESKNAHELLREDIAIKKLSSRSILKQITRDIFIPEKIEIIPPPDTRGPTAVVNEIKLKGKHSSIYWHFKIKSL